MTGGADGPQGRPELSVVVVSWNAREDLKRCLDSLLACTESVEFELIVVDNASSDGSPAMVRRFFAPVRLIENAENIGFGRGCNQGMAVARGEFVLLLNSDTYVVDDLLGRAIAYLRRRADVGMVGCAMRLPDGRHQYTANRGLGIRHSLFERLWLYKLLSPKRRAKALLGGYYDEDGEVEVEWLAGVFMLLRRELFDRSGGFDPRFFMYGEDSEWCMRLRRLGFKIAYAPELGIVYHRGAASSEQAFTERERLRRNYLGGIEAYAAIHGRRRASLYRLVELIGVTVRFAVYRVALLVRPDSYLREQAAWYRWLAAFYAGLDRNERGDSRLRRPVTRPPAQDAAPRPEDRRLRHL